MKSKIGKYAMMSILFLLTIFGIQTVHAEQYTGQAIWPSEHISNIYIKKDRNDGYSKWQQARFIRRSEDNKFVYCLQPYADIDNNLPYYDVIRSDYERVLGFSEAQWERISLLAYYGYQYNDNGYNHNDQKWYAITQVMIWRTTNPDSNIYFTDTLNGNYTSKFDGEMAELESLVSNHYKTPNLESGIVLPIGQTKELNDSNGVLSNYTITGTENVTASINGNTLSVTANSIGEGKVTFEKRATKYEIPPIVYFSDHSQNVFRVGNYDPVRTKFTLKVIGGRVTPAKVDVETKTNTPQGEAKLGGAVYGIYKVDGTRVGSVTTNDDGRNTSDYLPELGRFYLLEEKPSEGYLLDSNKYYFEITEDNLNPEVQVFEQVIKLDFEFTKVYASAETQIMEPEVGIKFGIYNKSGEQVKEITTDSQGVFRFTLPYGTYTVKQLTTTKGHEKIEDFNVEVKTTGEVVKKVISNAPITAKLRVVKIDAETKEVIKRANIKFKIFDIKNNEYVCQTITYPNKTTICEWETDSEGEFTTAYPLMTGTYRLEEVDQVVEGYLWNSQSHEFSIDENSKLRTDSEYGIIFDTAFENQPVKGEIQIKKTGEVAELTDNGFEFKTDSLEGVKFGLYAQEDIIWNDKVIYTKDSLVEEKITDKDGNIVFDNLYLGKYYVKELSTLDNYVLDENTYEAELIYKDQYTPVIVYSESILNILKTGKLEFTKTDISESKTLPNTLIEIYTENDELVFSGRTDENGKIVIERLPQGKYYILEKEAPEGYKLNEEKMPFEIKENGEIIKSTMKDEDITGTLEFTKVDISTDEPLPNTLIEIYNAENDELVFSGRTDENGNITIDKIKYGKYYILEKEAPAGYQLNPEKMYFEITEDGQVIKSVMKDEKIVEVPNTGLSEINYDKVTPIIVIVLGAGLIIYATKKNKKK
ncbi:MAG: Cys-Gln thioester bond-forming surface protein [Bacilli bacterium]|nr:Cys-Gln thioester bond-forming surface protein [Bacilli bacterium]MBR3161278.1 Cys-Gln thioester bond-forming surface protein [Bacilli bacterium]